MDHVIMNYIKPLFKGCLIWLFFQDWITATDIKIVLSRVNTYGDEVFNNDKVLQSYFYAMSDFSVGGRYLWPGSNLCTARHIVYIALTYIFIILSCIILLMSLGKVFPDKKAINKFNQLCAVLYHTAKTHVFPKWIVFRGPKNYLLYSPK